MGSEKQLKAQISAKGMQIAVVSDGGYDDYISLTGIARYRSEEPFGNYSELGAQQGCY